MQSYFFRYIGMEDIGAEFTAKEKNDRHNFIGDIVIRRLDNKREKSVMVEYIKNILIMFFFFGDDRKNVML